MVRRRLQGGDVALQDEVGPVGALDGLGDVGVCGVEQRTDLAADVLLPGGQRHDVRLDAGVGGACGVGHGGSSLPVLPLAWRAGCASLSMVGPQDSARRGHCPVGRGPHWWRNATSSLRPARRSHRQPVSTSTPLILTACATNGTDAHVCSLVGREERDQHGRERLGGHLMRLPLQYAVPSLGRRLGEGAGRLLHPGGTGAAGQRQQRDRQRRCLLRVLEPVCKRVRWGRDAGA